jgi:hypothetical protein
MPLLNPEQVTRFHREGFLALEGITSRDDLQHVQGLLDGLFARVHELPSAVVRNHGDPTLDPAAPQVPEIIATVRLEPRLKWSRTFHACRRLASELLQHPCKYYSDHAIYKPPHCPAATPWHQDEAYASKRMNTVHFWIPLQDVDEQTGCMRFLPRRHLDELLPHHKLHAHPEAHTRVADGIDPSGAVMCPLRAGGVTAHRPRTLHSTGPNAGDGTRRAWILHFGPVGPLGRLRPSFIVESVAGLLAAPTSQPASPHGLGGAQDRP